MTDEPGQTTASETSTDGRSELRTEDFTAEGRQRATERMPDGGREPRDDQPSGDDWEVRLFSDTDREQLRNRWEHVQQEFVDEPKLAVQDADALVAETIQSLAQTFSSARGALEERWSRGDNVDTEELRVTLQQYRSFFNRLLER